MDVYLSLHHNAHVVFRGIPGDLVCPSTVWALGIKLKAVCIEGRHYY